MGFCFQSLYILFLGLSLFSCIFYCTDTFFFLQWTTDQDLTDAISACGVSDLLEIKFNENRANGQSKG